MRLSLPLRLSLLRTKPLFAAATLALLAGCSLPPHVKNQFLKLEYRTALWNNMPMGEMSVKDKTLLVLNVPLRQENRDVVYEKYRNLFGNHGVLYVLPRKTADICGNTKNLPALSTAYLEDDGAIGNIVDMPANSAKKYCTDRPSSRFIVMTYQWFKNNGIKVGDKLTAFKPVTETRMPRGM